MGFLQMLGSLFIRLCQNPEPDFPFRRNIAYILKAIWNNPTHRQALKTEAGCVSVILAVIGSFAHTMQATSTNLLNLSI
jgi:hypothetical protein